MHLKWSHRVPVWSCSAWRCCTWEWVCWESPWRSWWHSPLRSCEQTTRSRCCSALRGTAGSWSTGRNSSDGHIPIRVLLVRGNWGDIWYFVRFGHVVFGYVLELAQEVFLTQNFDFSRNWLKHTFESVINYANLVHVLLLNYQPDLPINKFLLDMPKNWFKRNWQGRLLHRQSGRGDLDKVWWARFLLYFRSRKSKFDW